MTAGLGWATVVAIGGMFVLWLVQLRTRNAGIVDVGWAGLLGALALGYALVGDAAAPHRWLVAITGGGWGFRLAAHLWFDRVSGHPEEGRYIALRQRWGRSADRKLLWFFWAQAALVVWLSLPFLLTSRRPESGLTLVEWIGIGLWITGIVGEAIADRQLARFKARSDSKGKTCREGLWATSRHPNYFFEWVTWCGFATMALGSTNGWLALFAPATILLFLLKITGIPPTEAQALRSRGDDYRDYQRTTSAFVPWFPKRGR